MIQLPVYAIRSYEEIVKEGDYVIIVSKFNKYILDKPKLGGSFRQRRLELAITPTSELPYKLYPLKRMLTKLSQLVKSKSKVFVNSDGRILKRKKEKMYPIEVRKIVSGSRLFNGKFQCFAKGINSPFILDHIPKYVSVIKFNNSYLIYEVHEEIPEAPRVRVKI
ncbi:hypothetical protein P13BB106kb_p097 [Pectobacterium phage DU_PP_V]|uniref:Uncharacterized protein n=1 Tax=Pectobacterium phage DU_PP_V TaxID=2041492 RepID=A0A2D2W704_9CAUD|nr:hypothetical protein HOS40_gp072 [Pectobacterium phage DU_PP_V]ATS94081.1 hypothetical protein P13BB106kb_p097 [Pectobacterium phage DU_PP_V]